jgi:hypothetical protein
MQGNLNRHQPVSMYVISASSLYTVTGRLPTYFVFVFLGIKSAVQTKVSVPPDDSSG